MMRPLALLCLAALLCSGCARQLPPPPLFPVHSPEVSRSGQLRHLQVYQDVLRLCQISDRALAVDWTVNLPLEIPSAWKKTIPQLVVSFRSAQDAQVHLPPDFPLQRLSSGEMTFSRTHARDDWERLARAHAGVREIVELTAVGLDADDSQALVGLMYYHHIDERGYRQDLTWLQLKHAPQRWEIERRVTTGRTLRWAAPPTATPTP